MDFSLGDLQTDLRRFRRNLEDIDIERVKRRSMKRAAQELSEMVRQAVVAEPRITSPAFNGPYERGPGPSMSTGDAWIVEKDSNGVYTVKPHPSVKQRAVVLNYGYDGRIYPKNAEALRFKIEGTPVFRDWVPGPDETNYWELAIQHFDKSGKMEDIMADELEKEIERNL